MRWNPFARRHSLPPIRRPLCRPRLERLEDRLAPATLPPNFTETLIATSLSAPTAMEFAPDGRIFVAQQGGALRVIQNSSLLPTPFVTVPVDSSGERGLLGVAFDPNFASNQFVYVYYTATTPNVHNRVSRFTANGNVAVPGSEVAILDLENLSGATNHNGGAIHFGLDGKLYVAVGENASAANSQTLANRLGKMLRINPDGTIPTDNPFYNQASGVNRSIWALALRNPFTFAFQPGTGRMFINDVGAASWEEINDGIAGSNYGWPNCEGACGNPLYRDPLFQYGHGIGPSVGIAIVGGAFYNPATANFPSDYIGDYFFADLGSGWVRRFDPVDSSVTDFASGIANPVDLKATADGRLYYLTRGGGGQVWRVQYTAGPLPPIQILDNGSPGFATVGGWTYYGNQGYLNDVHASAAGTGSNTASWTFTVTPGQYRVAATWTPFANRATDAPFTVLDGSTPLATVPVNQEQAPNDFSDAGAVWENLGGTYLVTGNTLVARLSNLANEFVIADAVRVERIADLPPGPEIQVLDGATDIADGTGSINYGNTVIGTPLHRGFLVRNVGSATLTLVPPISVPAGFSLASGFGTTTLAPGASTTFTVRLDASSTGTFSGTVSFGNNDGNENPFDFTVSGTVLPLPPVQISDNGDPSFSTTGGWVFQSNQGYQNDVHYSAAGSGSNTATWTFGVTPGQYRVSATWFAFSNRATNAPYTIFDGATMLATVPVNQQAAPNDFSDAGAFWEDLGNPYVITGNTLTVRLSNLANGFVIADAIRVERVGGLPAGPEIQVLDGTTDVPDNTGVVNFGNTPFGTPLMKTFTVKNNGTTTLTLVPPITVPAGFSVASGFGTTSLAPGASTTFAVRLNGTGGTYSGPVSFGTDDADENPFNFIVTGSAGAQIIDNGGAGFAITGGGWVFHPNQGYQNNVHYSAAGTGNNTATWTFSVVPGQYRVAATWSPFSNRATNAPFTVLDGGAPLQTVAVNQKVAPGDFTADGAAWKYLGGTFTINGTTLVVRLTDLADGFVIADAIRIERLA